jgi:DNA-binding ferritin-like protein (Dps family)
MTMAPQWYEQKKEYRRYRGRIEQLPPSYRTAVAGLERYMNHLGGIDDADSILTMLNDLAELFERGAADGTPVREIVGSDPVEFIEAFLANYPAGHWITRERERLNDAIRRAEEEQAGRPSASP